MQTADGIIHYPTITAVSETDVILGGGIGVVTGYIKARQFLDCVSEQLVFMAPGTLEQKGIS